MNGRCPILLVLTLLCLAVSSPAQLHLPLMKKDKDSKTYQLDNVTNTLRTGAKHPLSDLAAELRIMAPNPTDPSSISDAPCTRFSQVEQKNLVLKRGAENAVIVAYSSDCDSTYLLAFEHAEKSEWRHLNTVRLESRVQKPEISYAAMVQAGVSDILVHRDTTQDKGNATQENFIVLKLLHDRLVPVLDTVEKLEVVLPTLTSDDGDQVEQSRKAVFNTVQLDPKSGAITRVLEKELITQRKASITQYRSWIWDPELERFRSTPSEERDIAQWPPPAPQPAKSAAAGKTAQPKPVGNPAAPK